MTHKPAKRKERPAEGPEGREAKLRKLARPSFVVPNAGKPLSTHGSVKPHGKKKPLKSGKNTGRAAPAPAPLITEHEEPDRIAKAEQLAMSAKLSAADSQIIKIRDPTVWKSRIHPEYLAINLKTGNIDVDLNFFWRVWGEYKQDSTWNAWVCASKSKVQGVIVTQMWVHESFYFRWGPPLNRIADEPDERTGEIRNVAEISIFCAKGCGSRLLETAERYLRDHTKYDVIVLNTTEGALEWYKSKGFKPVAAYRMPKPTKPNSNEHLYRHRVADRGLDPNQEPPSILLYKMIDR